MCGWYCIIDQQRENRGVGDSREAKMKNWEKRGDATSKQPSVMDSGFGAVIQLIATPKQCLDNSPIMVVLLTVLFLVLIKLTLSKGGG